MIRIRLGEADREALGAPEILEIDPSKIRAREAALLEQTTGLTVEQLGDRLKQYGIDAVLALVWLALRRNGIDVPYDEVDFELTDLEVTTAGEASAPQGASPSS